MTDEEGKIWGLAIKAWDKLSSQVGFETRRDAFLQGYYVAVKNTPTNLSEVEFTEMYKDLCRDAYQSKTAGDMWEADRYRSWYERIFKK